MFETGDIFLLKHIDDKSIVAVILNPNGLIGLMIIDKNTVIEKIKNEDFILKILVIKNDLKNYDKITKIKDLTFSVPDFFFYDKLNNQYHIYKFIDGSFSSIIGTLESCYDLECYVFWNIKLIIERIELKLEGKVHPVFERMSPCNIRNYKD